MNRFTFYTDDTADIADVYLLFRRMGKEQWAYSLNQVSLPQDFDPDWDEEEVQIDITTACTAWRLALQVIEMATVIGNIDLVLQEGDLAPHSLKQLPNEVKKYREEIQRWLP